MEENEKERIVPCQFMNKKGKLYFGIIIGKKYFIKINRKWLEIYKDGKKLTRIPQQERWIVIEKKNDNCHEI